MAYMTAAMQHRLAHNPKSIQGLSFMGNTIVTKQKESTVSEHMRMNMRDEMGMVCRSKLHAQVLTQGGRRATKCKSIIHQRIGYTK